MTRRTLFLIGLLFELIAVFGLFVPYTLVVKNGTPVTLRTVPVDPRSIFRGDFMTLDYEAGLSPPWRGEGETYRKVMYVVLEREGETFERVSFTEDRPTALAPGQVCLKGRLDWNRVVFPDLRQYFFEEGEGQRLGEASVLHRLFVDAAVTPSCRAVIRGVRIGTQIPQPEFQQWLRERSEPRSLPPALE